MIKNLLSTMTFAAFCLSVRAQTNTVAIVSQRPSSAAITEITGRTLFLKNCARCHGAAGHGEDGPDLHDLGLSDKGVINRIRKGKSGEMTAFAGKLQPAEIAALAAYVQSLK